MRMQARVKMAMESWTVRTHTRFGRHPNHACKVCSMYTPLGSILHPTSNLPASVVPNAQVLPHTTQGL